MHDENHLCHARDGETERGGGGEWKNEGREEAGQKVEVAEEEKEREDVVREGEEVSPSCARKKGTEELMPDKNLCSVPKKKEEREEKKGGKEGRRGLPPPPLHMHAWGEEEEEVLPYVCRRAWGEEEEEAGERERERERSRESKRGRERPSLSHLFYLIYIYIYIFPFM